MLCFDPGQLDALLLEGISTLIQKAPPAKAFRTLTLDHQTPTTWEVDQNSWAWPLFGTAHLLIVGVPPRAKSK